jgi:hydrogenase expression/formation protein HypC
MCLAIPGKVVSISGDDPLTRMGKIDFSGVFKQASLAYVPEVQIGDYVIVHVGFALSKVDEEEAHQVFEYLKQMGELGELDHPSDPAALSGESATAAGETSASLISQTGSSAATP